jgi:hypothetical protein
MRFWGDAKFGMWPEQEAQGTAVPQLFLQQLAAVGEGGQQAALLQLLQASLAQVPPQPWQAPSAGFDAPSVAPGAVSPRHQMLLPGKHQES